LSKNIKMKIYRSIILALVLYGCETWSLTLRWGQKTENVTEQGTEENIWTEEGRSDRRLEETA
jgi:hypothetical protein